MNSSITENSKSKTMRLQEFDQIEGISDIKQDREQSPIEPPTLIKSKNLPNSPDYLNLNLYDGADKENVSHNIPVKTNN